ncbi:peptidoglycan hydrolase-like protein with peptidoglycan-binding domain [Agromyces terreus]|uniref:Peptidoglycan hydrolase-like protein with peptidoglycan-binding domain n=1 Tax=Agromyces terreus TaxID=424795 RepID=A0A9X2H664_9MICO|nr:peptidoglycan-binding domain-containing protein [Agromyces terreus]MCP2371522.1 peptidoglycan hydrolase-like protein with peptidoglycan-binding domain [Agromyces terreus]
MKSLKGRLAAGALALAIAGFGAVIPATAANAAGSTGHGCTSYTYASGGYATCVGKIQTMLNGLATSRGSSYGGYQLAVDNSFGANTKTNVKRFQSYLGLVSDGIVGPITWNQLCRYVGVRSFIEYNSPAKMKAAWNAAYDAGCYVEKPAAGAGFTTVSKYPR